MSVPLTAREPVMFSPPSLEEERPDVKVRVRVPTPYERDNFDAALVRAGVVYYSRDQIRDLTLAGVAETYGEDQFDDMRAQLQELWQAGDAQNEARLKQAERFLELVEANKTSKKPLTEKEITAELEEIKPDVVMNPVARAKATALQQELLAQYQPLQKAFADLADQDTKRSWIQAETYVAGWEGLEHEPDGNGRGGLKRHEAEYLREQLGARAWEELAEFITALHSIDGDTQKNLDSLLAKQSDPTGLTAPESTETISEHGNSTEESTTATQGGESQATTARSSGSTKRTGTKTGKSKNTRTEKAG